MRVLCLRGSYSIKNINEVYSILKSKEFDCIDYGQADIDEYVSLVLDFYNQNVVLSSPKLELGLRVKSILRYCFSFVIFSKILFLGYSNKFQKKYFYNNVIDDLYNMMLENMFVVFLISFCFGINLGYQSYRQLYEYGAAETGLNLLFNLGFQQSGVLIAVFILAPKYVSQIIARVGFMKLTDEWFALEIMQVDPKLFWFKTKIFSLIVLVPFFAYFSIVSSMLGSFFIFNFLHCLSFQFMLSICYFDRIILLFYPLIKGIVIGGMIGLIASHESSLITKSSENILSALNQGIVIAVVISFLLNVLIDFIL